MSTAHCASLPRVLSFFMSQLQFTERRGRVLLVVSVFARRHGRVRLHAWPCSPPVAARGLQLLGFCTATPSDPSLHALIAEAPAPTPRRVQQVNMYLLAAIGLQFALQCSTFLSNTRSMFGQFTLALSLSLLASSFGSTTSQSVTA